MTAVALVACSAAGADPGAPASPAPSTPAGWKPLPSIAAAVTAAATTGGVVIDAAGAWGEPALGCYAVRLALHGGAATAAVLADQVLAGLQAAAAVRPGALSFGELVKPSATPDVLAFTFARPPYHGRVRAQLGDGRLTALACFGNQREPAACESACTRMLEAGP